MGALCGCWSAPIGPSGGPGQSRRVIALTSLGQATVVILLAISSIDAIAPLVAMAGLGGLLAAPVSPVARTLWPQLAEDQHRLDSLFTLDATSQELIFIAGPTTVAVLVSLSGPPAALLAAAACGAIGGLAFAYVVRPIWRPHPRTSGRARLGRPLVAPFTVLFLVAFGIGLIEVGVPAAAILDGNRSASGWLLAAWSLGSLVGGVISSRIRWRGGRQTSAWHACWAPSRLGPFLWQTVGSSDSAGSVRHCSSRASRWPQPLRLAMASSEIAPPLSGVPMRSPGP